MLYGDEFSKTKNVIFIWVIEDCMKGIISLTYNFRNTNKKISYSLIFLSSSVVGLLGYKSMH